MGSTEQVNVRVPAKARDLLLKIGARLRDDAAFIARLERWLAEQADPTAADLLAERLDQLEQRLAVMEAGRGAARVAVDTPAAAASIPPGAPPDSPQATPSLFGEPTRWTVGEGKGRRLTLAGEAELMRRIHARESDSEIAAAMGVARFTVVSRRKKLNLQPFEG